MPFSPRLPTQVDDFVARVKDVVGKIAQGDFFRGVAEKTEGLRFAVGRLVEKIPPEKRRLVLTVSAGFCAVLVLILAGASLRGGNKGREAAVAKTVAVQQGYIPPDDLFLPDEPDFIPDILLGREQRASWTADDASPLWQDPLRNGEEPWRDRIERTVDEIMESVP